ncbi:MAG TPA: PQQ-binding-like beta-propeller repeat protein, partial [Bryobacteraceae bacterium]|nr:PQQ-binding-like beta-propeller repeat protein [Bryobacteraceae bacterium]
MRVVVSSVFSAFVVLGAGADWSASGGGWESTRHSTLKQIHRGNVAQLQVAWKHDTGDAFEGSEMQCNPVVVRGVVYATTPKLRIIALDGASGKLLWSHDPHDGKGVKSKVRTRGLTYWESGSDRQLFVGVGHHLLALNAGTGKPVETFGNGGRIDLREGLGRDPGTLNVGANSPGVIYRDLLILGSIVPEGLPSAPGDIRAFDVRTGKQRWAFHTIPQPGEAGYDTWPKEAWKYTGGANSWPGLALDAERGIVYAPTGSAAFDFFGSNRHGDNLYANSLLALKAGTGERLWHYQFVRHDVWDRDLPSAPSLIDVKRDGKVIPAVAQITKSGHVWVFDRVKGTPLFPVEEINVPQSPVAGEKLAPKQRLPLKPAPFARQEFTEAMVTQRTPEAHNAVLEQFRKLRSGPQFTPPSTEGTIIFPGFDGGGEWGGPAWDPDTGLFYVNSNEMPWVLRLVPKGAPKGALSGRSLYDRNCAGCHRPDLAGSPPEFPALREIAKVRTREHIATVVKKGAGRMPGFQHLGEPALEAIHRFLVTGEDAPAAAARAGSPSPFEVPYGIDGYNRFRDPEGYPAVAPPWGTLNAISLNTGEYAWRIPFGEFPELAAKGLKNTGTENYGGGVVTAGGLLFIGATNHDKKFRAYDKRDGTLLWEITLDA